MQHLDNLPSLTLAIAVVFIWKLRKALRALPRLQHQEKLSKKLFAYVPQLDEDQYQ